MDAGFDDMGEIMIKIEGVIEDEKWNGRDQDINNSKKVIGKVFGVTVDDFGGSDDVEWEGEEKFRDIGKGTKSKSVGRSLDPFGAEIESFGKFAGNEKLGIFGVWMTVIKEETGERKCNKNTSKNPGENIVSRVEII